MQTINWLKRNWSMWLLFPIVLGSGMGAALRLICEIVKPIPSK